MIPKTLAKTITYIAYHAPDEYGLFWNPDGTMPWKELYWALQEDESLRFVRERHIREIIYLGLPLPFVLDGNLLRLKDIAVPSYPVAEPPERLYYAIRRKQHASVLENGLSASNPNRPFLPLSLNKELAFRIGRRRDPEPLLIECFGKKAQAAGVLFRKAGPELFLAESLAPEHLLCPHIREDHLHKSVNKKRTGGKSQSHEKLPVSPGSFFVDSSEIQDRQQEKAPDKKARRGPQWKREARKDRHKRKI